MYKPNLFIYMKSACAEKHIDTQNTNLPKIHTCRNIYTKWLGYILTTNSNLP